MLRPGQSGRLQHNEEIRERLDGPRQRQHGTARRARKLLRRLGIERNDCGDVGRLQYVSVYEKERLAGNFDFSQAVTNDVHASIYWPNLNLMNSC